ncbi:uncharacterized protein [Lolium perenne]|uniref:uncharacterized protein n=1 Tax=Lolium perenne TaxID=4522 RepID=UPI0021F531DC|nr:uncharacterized protein LOC127336583 isoform X2 [Lolium perenne]
MTRSRSSRSSGALLAGGQVSAVARAAARCPSSLFAAGLFHPSTSAVPPRRTSLDGWQRRGGARRRLGLQPLPTRAAARSCCRRPRSRAPAAGLNSVLLMPTISSSSCCRISSCYGVRELSLSAPNYLTEVAELKCSILAETLDGEGDVSDRLVGNFSELHALRSRSTLFCSVNRCHREGQMAAAPKHVMLELASL